MERLDLSLNGKLYSFTIVHMPSEHFQPPYAIGWIELPEGIRIFSQIRGWQEHPLKIGTGVFETLKGVAADVLRRLSQGGVGARRV